MDAVRIFCLSQACLFGVLFLHDSDEKALSGTGTWNSGKPFIDLTFADAAKVGKFVPGHFRKSEKLSDTGLHFIHERIFRIQKNLASHFWHIFYFRK